MVAFEASTLIILLLILVLGLLVPELFRKLKIPFVTALILIGTVLGPHGFDYVQSNEILEVFGFLGVLSAPRLLVETSRAYKLPQGPPPWRRWHQQKDLP